MSFVQSAEDLLGDQMCNSCGRCTKQFRSVLPVPNCSIFVPPSFKPLLCPCLRPFPEMSRTILHFLLLKWIGCVWRFLPIERTLPWLLVFGPRPIHTKTFFKSIFLKDRIEPKVLASAQACITNWWQEGKVLWQKEHKGFYCFQRGGGTIRKRRDEIKTGSNLSS